MGKNKNNESRILTLEKFIEKAKKIHNNLYNYSESFYKKGNACSQKPILERLEGIRC